LIIDEVDPDAWGFDGITMTVGKSLKMIREAEPRDRDEIQRLYEALCPDAPVRVLPERITEIREDSNNFLYVAEVDGKIAGTVMLTICLSPIFGTQDFGLIEYFIVDQNYRRQGIGRRLTEHLIQVCRARKCTRIILLSNDHRKEAHAFYESMGFDCSGKVGFVKYLNRDKAIITANERE
jgi:GNAT superfamily N-acetyltransferase